MAGAKTIIVTGGAGFIGSNLVEALINNGHRVFVIDNLVSGKRGNIHKNARFFQADIRHRKDLDSIFKKVGKADCVFHLAALPRVQFSIEHPAKAAEVNIAGLHYLLDCAVRHDVKRFVFVSSSAVYGNSKIIPTPEHAPLNPASPYALQKHLGELIVKLWSDLYNLSTVSLRLFNAYGKNQDPEGPYALVIPKFFAAAKAGKTLFITGDGSQTRDFIHISDVVDALIKTMESDRVGKGEVINIGSGENISIKELALLISSLVEHVPPVIEPKHAKADNRKARELLGWEPTVSLEKGITDLKTLYNL
jgi:UDP-glucose 4-epimerase